MHESNSLGARLFAEAYLAAVEHIKLCQEVLAMLERMGGPLEGRQQQQQVRFGPRNTKGM